MLGPRVENDSSCRIFHLDSPKLHAPRAPDPAVQTEQRCAQERHDLVRRRRESDYNSRRLHYGAGEDVGARPAMRSQHDGQEEALMRPYTTPIVMITALLVGYFATNRYVPVQAQGGATQSFAAIANDTGSLQPTGPYEVVPNWPKDLSTIPGKE